MKIKNYCLFLALGMFIASSTSLLAQEKDTSGDMQKVQTVCLLTGRPINKNPYVDYDGKRIYVCCKGCIETIKENPQKYLDMLKEQGITPESVNPDSSQEAKPEIKIDEQNQIKKPIIDIQGNSWSQKD